MRAREFMREFTELLSIVPTTQVELEPMEPGTRLSRDGDTKWSPPLQQQLDVMKDVAQAQVDDAEDDSTEISPSTTAIFAVTNLP